MADVLNVDGEPGDLEVDTEYEDNLEEPPRRGDGLAAAEEVEEEDESEGEEDHDEERTPSRAGSSASGATDGNYAVPEANKEVWKQFGCNTEAGRMLRRLYGGNAAKAGVSKVAYPRVSSPVSRWEPAPAAPKACPQRAAVRVPRPNPRRKIDPDDPRHWRVPLPGRKMHADIVAEMEAEEPEKPDIRPGRDQVRVKQALQDRFQYCGGKMMPPAAMGHVASGSIPEPAVNVAAERRLVDENGMNAEQRDMFEEITLDVREKQVRLAEIDATESSDPRPSKDKTDRNKEALQLRNDIDRNLKDLDKLMELTD